MQSAATLPCNSNGGIKRTASNSVAESTTSTNTVNSEHSISNQSNSIDQDRTTSPPPEKRSFIVVESPIKLDTISSAEDLDIKVLRIQNKNLSERLVQRQKLEAELRDRIAQLQNKKAADDSKTILIDRYWTQLDEDLRLVLERFDNESSMTSLSSTTNEQTNIGEQSAIKSEPKSGKQANSTIRNFLAKLNDWDRVELEENLKERVKFTNQTVAKVMINYDRYYFYFR
jgi:E3 ubiquitin-protein ligase BRE1